MHQPQPHETKKTTIFFFTKLLHAEPRRKKIAKPRNIASPKNPPHKHHQPQQETPKEEDKQPGNRATTAQDTLHCKNSMVHIPTARGRERRTRDEGSTRGYFGLGWLDLGGGLGAHIYRREQRGSRIGIEQRRRASPSCEARGPRCRRPSDRSSTKTEAEISRRRRIRVAARVFVPARFCTLAPSFPQLLFFFFPFRFVGVLHMRMKWMIATATSSFDLPERERERAFNLE